MKLPISNRIRMRILDFVRKTNQLQTYNVLLENQFKYSSNDIEDYQKGKISEIVKFHYENNSAYRKYLNKNGFVFSDDFDFTKLPFITKEFFRENSETCYVKNEINIVKHSGGSTGTPLAVYLGKDSIEHFWPSIWRSFSMKGILPCDRIMMIAGPSLFNNRSLKRRIYDWVNRFTVVSAFDLNDDLLKKAYETILKKNIKAIYGYTSSVLVFLQYLQKNQLKLSLNAIFTTSETFIPAVRRLALEYCDCDVIDTYGANDGGVQSFECEHHVGYHINFERCYVEIINGEIVLTDLLNKAAPFIRYKVGDFTDGESVIKEKCKCGRSLFRISSISGRVNQFIEDIDSSKIHTEFFSHIFKADIHILRYQILQRENKLIINIIHDNKKPESSFEDEYSPLIKRKFKMPFEFVFNQSVIILSNMKVPILVKE